MRFAVRVRGVVVDAGLFKLVLHLLLLQLGLGERCLERLLAAAMIFPKPP